MKRFILVVFFIVSCVCLAGAQGKDNSLKGTPFKERLVTGGGFGLSFGNVQDFISVSPMVGYMFTAKLMGGLNFTYRYTNYKAISPSIKLNDYGVSPFVRFTVYKNIFIQTEYEYLNYEYPGYPNYDATTRKTFNSFLAGGGFIQPIGDKAAIYFMALYNFSYTNAGNAYSPYNSPLIIRGGINIGGISF